MSERTLREQNAIWHNLDEEWSRNASKRNRLAECYLDATGQKPKREVRIVEKVDVL